MPGKKINPIKMLCERGMWSLVCPAGQIFLNGVRLSYHVLLNQFESVSLYIPQSMTHCMSWCFSHLLFHQLGASSLI